MNGMERIAVLETKVSSLETQQAQILAELTKLNNQITKYKGFIGGAWFLITCFITFLELAKEGIVRKLGF